MANENEMNRSVFIVDDDKFLLNMYAVKFQKTGFAVETAQSGQEALTKLRAGFKPAIMMLDIVMPGMDGLELLDTIKKDKLDEGSVTIMLTNQGGSAEIERAKELGVHGYIVKATSIPSEVVEEVLKIAEAAGK